MAAGAELQSKLQQRLQRVGTLTVTVAGRDGKASVRTGRRASDPAALSCSPLPVAVDEKAEIEASLRARIEAVVKERDQARQQKQGIENAAVASGIELGAEVAKLRVDVEVLRRDLEAAQTEAQKLRKVSHIAARRDSALQERCRQVGAESAAAEARRVTLSSELHGSTSERGELEERVRSLEEAIASHVVGRVQLEAMLRCSQAREAEMRRMLIQAEASTAKSPDKASVSRVFALDQDDDEDEASTEGEDNDYGDLEFTYEGLELSNVMSVDRALELARARGRQARQLAGADDSCHDTDAQDDSATEEAGVAERTGGDSDEDEYEAPLRALQWAVEKLRGGGRGGGPEEAEGRATAPAAVAAGTGEAEDSGAYVEQLDGLQQDLRHGPVLGRLSGLRPDAPLAVAASTGSAPTDAAPAPPAEEETPAKAPASPTAGEPAPARPLAVPMVPLTTFRLFSPYAQLGQKYQLRVQP